MSFIDQINLNENRKDNQEWTIQSYRQHWSQDTERRQTQKQHNNEN